MFRFRILQSALVLLAALATVSALGCGGDTVTGNEDNTDQVLQPNDPANLNGRAYSLTSYLWRDFMPVIGDDSLHTSLTAAIRVAADDSLALPATLSADRIWVINGDDVWESDFSGEPYPLSDCAFECVARGGPFWETGITVDVVVRLVENGTEILVEASDVVIHRTD